MQVKINHRGWGATDYFFKNRNYNNEISKKMKIHWRFINILLQILICERMFNWEHTRFVVTGIFISQKFYLHLFSRRNHATSTIPSITFTQHNLHI